MADPKHTPDEQLDITKIAEEGGDVDLDAAADAPADGAADPDLMAADIAALTAERDDMRDRWMRALAESENVRKRADRDRREAEAYGGSRMARDMLPVYDNLQRALKAAQEAEGAADAALQEGVELTLRELKNVFAKHGVKIVTPEVGETFDPQIHEAMFEAPVPGTKAGEIIQVMAEGFMLNERLLRPAQVGVSSTPAS